MDLIDAALARLSGDRTDAMQRSQPQPPSYRYQDREGRKVRLAGSDGSEAEVRMLTSGSLRAGDPVIRVGSVGIGRDGSRMPERRRFRPLPVEAGFWVYSSHEGLSNVLQNDDAGLRFTFNTRPNTTLHSDVQEVSGGETIDYYYTSWMREVDFSFARYLTVTTPMRITITYARDHLMARYTSGEFFSANPQLFFRAYMMSATQPTLNSPNDILADAIARHESGEIFISAYIENDFVPPALSNPWNRHWILRNQINSPTFGIDYVYGAIGSTSTSETTVTLTLDLNDPGTYLLLGTLGTQLYAIVDYFGGSFGDTLIDPTDPNSNMIWWMNLDTTIAIAPIPPP